MADRVLVVGPAWVGDMVLAHGLFRKLRRMGSVDTLHVLAPPQSLALTELMPEVDQAVPLPIGHGELSLAGRWRVARRLAALSYDWAIVMPRSFKSALIPLWARIPRRTGFLGEMRIGLINDVRRHRYRQSPRTLDRFLSLVDGPGGADAAREFEPRLVVTDRQIQDALAATGLERPRSPTLALCPGAEYGPAKQWPVRHFARLAAGQARDGRTIWVLGSDSERDLAAEICGHAGRAGQNLAGRTDLVQAAALLSLCDAVVSNDSGLMHIAAALGKRTIGLFGSSSPKRTPPLGDHGTALWLGLGCSPCFKRHCPLGHTDCLNRLTPDMVSAALDPD